MMRCRELERSNLTTLTLQSDEAIKELQRKKDKVSLKFFLKDYLLNQLSSNTLFYLSGSASFESCRNVPQTRDRGGESIAILWLIIVC